MSMPLISTNDIVQYLENALAGTDLPVQVIDEYPSVEDNVPYGVYVDSVDSTSRDAFQLALQSCGSIYTVTDEFQIQFVSFQKDPQGSVVEAAIQGLSQDSLFFDGYHQVTYVRDTIQSGSRNDISTYTFNMIRLDFNMIAN